MERLQAAIEKARAQRKTRDVPGQRAAAATPAEPVLETTPSEVDQAWEALAPVKLQDRLMHRNRLVAFHEGKEAGPYDMLRTRMLQQARTNGWKRIAIVSPHSNCGKSTTAANLAFSMSRQPGLRALVLDLDLRRFGLSRMLGQRPDHGMIDVFSGEVSFASHGRRYEENVAFGFNGSATNRASEILQSSRTHDTLDAIEAVYQPAITLVDMPPLMASDDNFGFLQHVDAALIMVAAEKTSMTQLDVAERQVAELTNVMGMVLNKCRYTDGAYGYEYGYY
ncbi:P-loop NTPase [Aquicoccus sp. SCR17]|nr:P-loop NTPase [Carideicomes alvinocaridis]